MSATAIIPDALTHYVDDWHMSPAIDTGALVFFTGMTGHTVGGPPDPDPRVQIERAFERVAATLAEAGLDFGHVVEMTTYHVGLQDHLQQFRDIRDRYVRQPYPAWTAIEVAGFVTPGIVCEIRVIARKDPAT